MTPQRQQLDDDARIAALQHQLATTLIAHLCGLDQALRLYDLNNAMVFKVLGDIREVANDFARQVGEPMSLAMSQHTFFVNRRLVRMSFTDYRRAQQLRKIWIDLGIGEILFPPAIELKSLREFATHFAAAINDPRSSDLTQRPWGEILVRAAVGRESEWRRHDPRGFTIRVYCALCVLVRQVLVQLQQGQRPPIVRIKRTLQVLVDRLDGNEGLLLAVARQNAQRGELAVHMVNVCLYALLLARQLSLSRLHLVGLATAALLHDLPKAALKDSTLNSIERPEGFAAADRVRVDLHWLNTLRTTLETGGMSDEAVPRAVVIYESQLEFTRRDLYPAAPPETSPQSLFSRIIAIGDLYDTATWTRPGRDGRAPHQALMAVLEAAGGRLDPTLARMFVDVVGLYPLGSAVLLSSGEVAVVTAQNPAGELERPVVRVVADAEGQPVEGAEVDLVREAGRTILWCIDAARLGINSVACFAGR